MIRLGPSGPATGRDSLAWAAVAAGLSLAIWWLRFDYTWATGDQDEFIPYLLNLLNPKLLSTDWFVQTQRAAIGVRTPFVAVLRVVCYALTPGAATAFIFVFSWAAIAWSVFALTRSITPSNLSAVVATVVVLSVTPKWTLGGNDVTYTMLVPEMTAWALGLPGIVLFFRRRLFLAGLLVGLAGWMQLLVGVHLTLMLGLTCLLDARGRAASWIRDGLKTPVIATVVFLPLLIVIAIQQWSGTQLPGTGDGPDPLWILTKFRAPYHYLPHTFAWTAFVKTGLLTLVGIGGLMWFRKRGEWSPAHKAVFHMLVAIALLVGAAALFVEAYPVEFIVKLQMFKLTAVAKVLLVAAGVAAGISAVYTALDTHGLPISDARIKFAFVVATLALLGASVIRQLNKGDQSTLRDLEDWVAASTDYTSVFLVPPSVSSFRSRAQRPIVVNYAAVPFAPEDLREWYRRLSDVAPVSHPLSGIAIKGQLDDSYYSRTPSEWRVLADRYSIQYLVLKADEAMPLPFHISYQDSSWVIYALTPSPDASSPS